MLLTFYRRNHTKITFSSSDRPPSLSILTSFTSTGVSICMSQQIFEFDIFEWILDTLAMSVRRQVQQHLNKCYYKMLIRTTTWCCSLHCVHLSPLSILSVCYFSKCWVETVQNVDGSILRRLIKCQACMCVCASLCIVTSICCNQMNWTQRAFLFVTLSW